MHVVCPSICLFHKFTKKKRSGVCYVLGRIQIKKGQATNKISLHGEAISVEGQFSTVLLDFHGRKDKMGLQETGKTRVVKSLKFWIITTAQHQTTSMPWTLEPGKRPAGLTLRSTHTASIFPYLLCSHSQSGFMNKLPKCFVNFKNPCSIKDALLLHYHWLSLPE